MYRLNSAKQPRIGPQGTERNAWGITTQNKQRFIAHCSDFRLHFDDRDCRESAEEQREKDRIFTGQVQDLFATLKLVEKRAGERNRRRYRLTIFIPSQKRLGDDDHSWEKLDCRIVIDLVTRLPTLRDLVCHTGKDALTPSYQARAFAPCPTISKISRSGLKRTDPCFGLRTVRHRLGRFSNESSSCFMWCRRQELGTLKVHAAKAESQPVMKSTRLHTHHLNLLKKTKIQIVGAWVEAGLSRLDRPFSFRISPNDNLLGPFLASFSKATAKMPDLRQAVSWSRLKWDVDCGDDDEREVFDHFEPPENFHPESLAWGLAYYVPRVGTAFATNPGEVNCEARQI
ncbi:hypothetical protein P153DRAFT_434628 [Dothidotthia symphoricarpi CBS 119687]|uniref:Uncharacterized protein n=1 Tax=Dothidotthia symphoricarpi CBS 119687 TaxID=1392245 RepID=A0A6A6A053_9PLEO|nr:uncharacterized protein P153DRAFT_434628 [Dothidotthia symphoricarpi CBS 119687]KAF2124906.1 hypothetical protein P153DRAFT_434628 [Dothidotthia symphoricarpi CBS 119687]